ncbi:uncharacterized protein LOC144475562 [Augochlora pura]
MRSTTLFNAFVLTVACSLLVQELQATCTCGNLGSGTNPCTCSDTVVKAAKLPKPTFFATPEDINDAAAVRNSIVIPNTPSLNGYANSQSTGNFNSLLYTNNANTNAYISSKSDTVAYSNTDSGLNAYSSDNSNTYSDGSSIAYNSNGAISYSSSDSDVLSNSNSNSDTITITSSNSPVITSDSLVKSDSGCGCSKQISETLDVDESSDSNINIVPSFTPIGDLCYPLPIDSRSGKLIEKTRVIPAYPGQIICNTCNPAAPYEICINTHSGETTTRMLNGATSDSSSSVFGIPSTSTFDNSGFKLGSLGNINSGTFGGPSSAFSTTKSGSLGNGKFSGSASGPFGGFGAPRLGLFGNRNSGVFGRSQLGKYSSSNLGTFGQNIQSGSSVYNSVPSSIYTGSSPLLNVSPTPCGRTTVLGSGFDDDETIDDGPTDYSYPQVPADAVSLTLAYKNLRAPNVIYRQGKQFVPEDKLSFGHRTVPNDVKNEKKIVDIAEEKLVTVDKPVVELKIAPPRTVVIGSYDEREEAKLAELEAIERESITQEEVVDQGTEGLLTYRDLGYAPVGSIYANSRSYSGIINGESDDSMEEPCGSLGPPVPGYIPGSVIVQQGVIKDKFANSPIGDIIDKRLVVGCAN